MLIENEDGSSTIILFRLDPFKIIFGSEERVQAKYKELMALPDGDEKQMQIKRFLRALEERERNSSIRIELSHREVKPIEVPPKFRHLIKKRKPDAD